MKICKFVSQFSKENLGVINNVRGMKSESIITNKRGEKKEDISKEPIQEAEDIARELCIRGEESFQKSWISRRITFIDIECVF